MGVLRFRGVKLRDLGVDISASPPMEKGLKGCRGLQVTVAARIDTLKSCNCALCGGLPPQGTTCLA